MEEKYSLVDILGITYKVFEVLQSEDVMLRDCAGYTDTLEKKIVIVDYAKDIDFANKDETYVKRARNEILRHEVIHAFLYESGLWHNSFFNGAWAMNEEMVDWFALQFPKISKAFLTLGCEV